MIGVGMSVIMVTTNQHTKGRYGRAFIRGSGCIGTGDSPWLSIREQILASCINMALRNELVVEIPWVEVVNTRSRIN